jgi:peptidoglycan/xylan/chitin deacetylase (PgdA/CDA1 family)
MSVICYLIYHDVVEERDREAVGFPGPLAARYKLTAQQFESHLDAIAATGVEVGTVDPDRPLPRTALTFDDGGSSALAAAAALERRGWRGHFFVATGRLDTPGFLTSAAVGELAVRGHIVGSHSHSHPTYMGKLSRAEIEREWRESRTRLGDLLGVPPVTASVPGGFLSRAVVHGAAEAGYRLLMTSEPVSKVEQNGELVVIGRYTVWSTTPPERAAAYARGNRRARMRLWAEWNVKGLAKRASPSAYQAVRKLRARLG